MARLGVSENQVFQVADQLSADDVRPTVDAVRIALGNTGSRTTINKYLKAWRERRTYNDAVGANLGGHLRQVITEQAELLLKALEAESALKALNGSKELEAALGSQRILNQQLEITLSECHGQLATLQDFCEQKNLQQLRQNAELTDLHEQNQAYREALVKEIGRRETLERQLAAFQKALTTTPDPKEKISESPAGKTAELKALQLRERIQGALIKEKVGEIKQLKLQLKAACTQHDKDLEQLSRSLAAAIRSTSKPN